MSLLPGHYSITSGYHGRHILCCCGQSHAGRGRSLGAWVYVVVEVRAHSVGQIVHYALAAVVALDFEPFAVNARVGPAVVQPRVHIACSRSSLRLLCILLRLGQRRVHVNRWFVRSRMAALFRRDPASARPFCAHVGPKKKAQTGDWGD